MGLIIFENKEASAKLKCTIQKTGRLGFTDATSKQLQLGSNKYMQFASDETDQDLLYLINNTDSKDSRSYKVVKAGDYFYVQAKTLFDDLGLDYVNNSIIFDMTRDYSFEDMEIYKLKKRILPRKKKE